MSINDLSFWLIGTTDSLLEQTKHDRRNGIGLLKSWIGSLMLREITGGSIADSGRSTSVGDMVTVQRGLKDELRLLKRRVVSIEAVGPNTSKYLIRFLRANRLA